MVHFADANDILQTLHLPEELRQVLQTFVVSLSLLIGDDVKVSREAQVMQSVQLNLGKADLLGPGSDSDTITFSLLLHHLVRQVTSSGLIRVEHRYVDTPSCKVLWRWKYLRCCCTPSGNAAVDLLDASRVLHPTRLVGFHMSVSVLSSGKGCGIYLALEVLHCRSCAIRLFFVC